MDKSEITDCTYNMILAEKRLSKFELYKLQMHTHILLYKIYQN